MKGLFKGLFYALVFAQLLALMGTAFWITELFSHYAPYYALLAVVLIFEQISRHYRRRKIHAATLGLLILIASWNLWILSPYLLPYLQNSAPTEVSQKSAEEPHQFVRILSQNVYYENPNLHEIFPLLESTQPTILVVHEASAAWEELLPQIQTLYPNVKLSTKTGIHGILVASQIEGHFEEIPLGDQVGIRFVSNDESFQILAVHPEAPLSPSLAKARSRQFEDIVHFVHSQSVKSNGEALPTVVIGDFNCTPWSSAFTELLKQSALRDARVGLNFYPTWHAHNPLFKLLIDHALLSPEWTAVEFKTHSTPSADHKAIQVDLKL